MRRRQDTGAPKSRAVAREQIPFFFLKPLPVEVPAAASSGGGASLSAEAGGPTSAAAPIDLTGTPTAGTTRSSATIDAAASAAAAATADVPAASPADATGAAAATAAYHDHALLPGSIVVSADGKQAAFVLLSPATDGSASGAAACSWDIASGAPQAGKFALRSADVAAVYATALSASTGSGSSAASESFAVGSRVRVRSPEEIVAAIAAAAASIERESHREAVVRSLLRGASLATKPLVLPEHPAESHAGAAVCSVADWTVMEVTFLPGQEPAAGARAAAAPPLVHIYSPSTGAAALTLALWLEPQPSASASAAAAASAAPIGGAGAAPASTSAASTHAQAGSPNLLPEDSLLPRLLALCESAPAVQSAARALLAWYASVAAPAEQLSEAGAEVGEALGLSDALARGPAEEAAAAAAAAIASSEGIAALASHRDRLGVPPSPAQYEAHRPGTREFRWLFEPREEAGTTTAGAKHGPGSYGAAAAAARGAGVIVGGFISHGSSKVQRSVISTENRNEANRAGGRLRVSWARKRRQRFEKRAEARYEAHEAWLARTRPWVAAAKERRAVATAKEVAKQLLGAPATATATAAGAVVASASKPASATATRTAAAAAVEAMSEATRSILPALTWTLARLYYQDHEEGSESGSDSEDDA